MIGIVMGRRGKEMKRKQNIKEALKKQVYKGQRNHHNICVIHLRCAFVEFFSDSSNLLSARVFVKMVPLIGDANSKVFFEHFFSTKSYSRRWRLLHGINGTLGCLVGECLRLRVCRHLSSCYTATGQFKHSWLESISFIRTSNEVLLSFRLPKLSKFQVLGNVLANKSTSSKSGCYCSDFIHSNQGAKS